MSWKEALESFLENLSNEEGRACRAEFWWVQLFWLIFVVVVTIFQVFVLEGIFSLYEFSAVLNNGIGYVGFAFLMSVSIRRMHDTNRSGIWYFMPVILIPVSLFVFWIEILESFWKVFLLPGISVIVFYVFASLPGDKNENKYGKNPLLKN